MKITFDVDPLDANRTLVFADGNEVGHLKRAQHGPGFFLKLDGKTWQNAPGARHTVERDARTEYTYVKTLKQAACRVQENVT
jgi:hypothetical protein